MTNPNIATSSKRRVPLSTKTFTARAVLILSLSALISGCGEKAPEVRPVGEEIRGVTAVVETVDIPVIVMATGSVEPDVRVSVSTRMMGWVSALHVTEGDVVEKGQRLLSIDAADMRAKKAQVEAGIREAVAMVANAEKTTDRFQNLYEAKAVSKQQLDDVLTGLERARAGLAQAQAARAEIKGHMEYLEIRSPMAGVITRHMVDVGDMASPGHPLLFVDKLDRMKIVAHLGEKYVDAVIAGDLVTVNVTSLDHATYQVEVALLISSANPGSRTYDIEMYVENDPRLRPGMFAKVSIPIGTRRGVVVPDEAIHRRGQLTGVWLLDEQNEVHLRWLRLGNRIEGGFQVVSGLAGGEILVLSSEKPLAEGDKVVR